MSRIGRMPIALPKGVTAAVGGDHVIGVKGPKGELKLSFNSAIGIKVENNQVLVSRASEEKEMKALHGLYRALINNMVKGVTEGFEKSLQIQGVGFRAQKSGKKLVLNLGYSHPVEVEEPAGVTFEVPAQDKIIVKGMDRQAVGNMAAVIRGKREPESYHGTGIRYEGEVVKLKAGKSGKK